MQTRALAPLFLLVLLAGCAAPPAADDRGDDGSYASLLDSPIRGLTPEEIEQLRSGEGMGLSLPAELNGYPGPKHVLDLADDLGLTAGQRAQVLEIRLGVVENATRLGEEILAVHGAIDDGFRNGTVNETTLRDLLADLDGLSADLRFVHLHAHMLTAEVLTPHQRALYMELRGYGEADHGAHEH